MQRQLGNKQVNVAFVLSAISGVLIVLQGVLRVIRTQWGLELGLGEIRRHSVGWLDFKVLGVSSIAMGIMVLIGCLLIRKSSRKLEGGITVIVFSALSILSGGGYYAAFILGLIAGWLAITEYRYEQQKTSNLGNSSNAQ